MKYWSKAHDQYLIDNWRTMSASQLGTAIGKSKNAVIGRICRLHLPTKREGERLVTTTFGAPWRPGEPVPARVTAEYGFGA